jgi:hypothetical protein
MAVDIGVLSETEASGAIDLADHVASARYELPRKRSA